MHSMKFGFVSAPVNVLDVCTEVSYLQVCMFY